MAVIITLGGTSHKLSDLAPPDTSLNLNGQRIVNLAAPTAADDAVSKAYLTTALSGLGTGGGTGDMLKSIYDPSNHGYVDHAAAADTATHATTADSATTAGSATTAATATNATHATTADSATTAGSATTAATATNATHATTADSLTTPVPVWTTVNYTSSATLTNYTRAVCDTSGGAFTLTLPPAASSGLTRVQIIDKFHTDVTSTTAGFALHNLNLAAPSSYTVAGVSSLPLDRSSISPQFTLDGTEWGIDGGVVR